MIRNRQEIQEARDEARKLEEKEILEKRVDKHTLNVKRNLSDWNQYYDGRFVSLLKNKQNRMEELTEKWHKPNQAVPAINKT